MAVVGAYAFTVTYGIGKLIDLVMGFRAPAQDERAGLDLAVHAESAYDYGSLSHGATQTGAGSPAPHTERAPVTEG